MAETQTHCNCKDSCELNTEVLQNTSLVKAIKEIATAISESSSNLRGITLLYDKTALPECAAGSFILANFDFDEDGEMLIQKIREMFHTDPKMVAIIEKGMALYLDDCANDKTLNP
jgi:predicted HAD superfamily phosphohydrolase